MQKKLDKVKDDLENSKDEAIKLRKELDKLKWSDQ